MPIQRIVAAASLLVLSAAASAQPAPATVPAQPGATAPAPASARTLFVGDVAPPLTVAKWVKGDPIGGEAKNAHALPKGKVYVVEFWATWCPPCRQSIPHLSELQAAFRDRGVVVIGVSSHETNGLQDVEQFVRKMGTEMAYTVGWDHDGQTSRAWMGAAAQEGIPTAFVVDREGRVAWIGHPMEELDAVLERVVAGTFDMAAAAVETKRRDEIEARARPLIERAQEQFQSGEHRASLATFDQIIALDPKVMGEWAFYKFELMAVELEDYDGAYAFAERAIGESLRDNAQTLNALAWMILDHPDLKRRDLRLARRAAERANALTGDRDPGVLDTLARALFETGETAKALEMQDRAVGLAKPGALKDQLEERLAGYRAKANGER